MVTWDANSELGSPAALERYREYVRAFNSADLAALGQFLADDVVFDFGDGFPTLVGREAFLEFYRHAWSYFTEKLTVLDVRANRAELSAWVENDIRPFRDWPDCPLGAMAVDVALHVHGRMSYLYDDDLCFVNIKEVDSNGRRS